MMNWLGTLNNPSEHYKGFMAQDFLEAHSKHSGVTYLNGQLEKGADGTVHLQWFVSFKKPGQRLSALKKMCKFSHWTVVRQDNGASSYCLKEDTRIEGPWEFGVKPVQRNSKVAWEEVKEHAMLGELDKIPADIFVRHYGNLK
jgi:hypothetical protein